MISHKQLEQWKALANAATPGPWHAPSIADGVRYLHRNEAWYGYGCSDSERVPGRQDGDGGTRDGAFIAAAREAVPVLIAEVEAQAKEIERLREHLASIASAALQLLNGFPGAAEKVTQAVAAVGITLEGT